MKNGVVEDTLWSRLAEYLIGIGDWRIDSSTCDISWSPHMFRLFGFAAGSEPPIEEAMNRLHPDDRARAYSNPSRDLQGHTETAYSRILLPDGAIRVIEGGSRLQRNQCGDVVAVIGAVIDVTHLVGSEVHPGTRQPAALARNAAELSHELRTPLTTIVGYAHLLSTNASLPASLQAEAKLITSASRSLLAVANSMLGNARADAVLLAEEETDITVSELVRECLDLFQPQSRSPGVSLRYWEGLGSPISVRTYAGALRQIIINLVGNAVKFTEHGSVEVRASYDDSMDRLVLTVKDTGQGFDPATRETMFGRFERGDSPHRPPPSGAGLGLSIVRGLVDALDGEICVDSAPGCGSHFSVTLPCPLTKARAEPLTATCARILVVDDNASIREIATRILAAAGANVAVASDGFGALEISRREAFDIILLDINMPDLRGDWVAMELRSRKVRPAPLLVAMTATEPSPSLMKFFDDWIQKPFDPTEFVRLILTSQQARAA